MADTLEADLKEMIDSELDTVLDYSRDKDIEETQKAYSQDPLFSRFNLDTKEFVLAKYGAGFNTSITRKLGDLIEENTRHIFSEKTGIDDITYDAEIVVDGEKEIRELDALLLLDEVDDGDSTTRLQQVINEDGEGIGDNKSLSDFTKESPEWRGIGFEIRHCYQSADSKRVGADITMAKHLKSKNIMPVMLIFCNDSNQPVISRYRNHMFVYEGNDSFDLVERLTGFDYAEFLDDQEEFIDTKMDKVFEMF